MDPFKVICVTCKAKLSVRNEALIGQIVGCPRCGSMVEVAKPSAAAAAVAVTESTESTINLTARQIEEVTQAASTTEPQPTPEAPSTPADAAETVPVEMLQATAEVAKYKIITWSLAGFVIGATLVGAVLYKGRAAGKKAPTQVQADATPVIPSNEPDTSPSVDEPIEVEPTFETPLPTEEAPVETVAPAELAVEEEVLAAEEPPQPIDAPAPIEPTASEPEEVDDTPTLTVEPAVPMTRPFNPLQFDLASLSLAKLDQSRDPDTQAVDPTETKVPADAPEPLPLDDEPDAPPVVRLGQPNKKAPFDRNADKQLKLLIPSVEFKDLPLLDALQLVSQLSGQPVSVAPEQLLMAGITSQKKVSLKATDISLNEVLDKILSPLQLEFTTDGPQIIVRRKEAAKLREIKYPVDDLLSEEFSAQQLANWIEQLIAPDSWQSSGGNGLIDTNADSLRITQPQHVQYQVLILLERLRLARNLPPKSRYPVARLVGAPAPVLLAEKLSNQATFTFTADTPIAQVFAHWQAELGSPLLIDWPALAETDMHPSTPIACAIIDEPWHVALDKVLEPLGLGWRAVTGSAIEITSAARATSDLQVELFSVQSFDEAALANLTALASQHSTNESGTLFYDPVGQVVLAAQPATAMRAIHRQLRDENLLDVR